MIREISHSRLHALRPFVERQWDRIIIGGFWQYFQRHSVHEVSAPELLDRAVKVLMQISLTHDGEVGGRPGICLHLRVFDALAILSVAVALGVELAIE